MEMPTSVENTSKVERIEQLMKAITSLRLPMYRTLALCQEPQKAEEIEAAIARFTHGHVSMYQPATIFDWLQEAGALEPLNVPEGDLDAAGWTTTASGRSVLETSSPIKQLTRLIDGNPKYRDSYERMLTFCLAPRSRDEIEKHFEGDPALVTPKLYPAALIGDLEEVGAIEWAEKWKTTDLAKEFLQ
jgi:hypothetical protein